MRLFAANTMQQNQEFQYRLTEDNRTIKQAIPSGQQRMISDDKLTEFQAAAIVESNEKYGMCWADKIAECKAPQITMLFRRDEPVPAGLIEKVMQNNRKELSVQGKERRAELAVVAASLIGRTDEHAGLSTSVGMEEVEPGTVSRESGDVLVEGHAGPESNVAKLRGGQEPQQERPSRRRGPRGY